MEKKKMKLWKKILIVLLIIILFYLIIGLCKFSVLTKINKNYEESRKLSNYYYYSQTEDTIITHWQKDNLKKTNIKQVNGDGNLTFWKDENTGEELVFWENIKKYAPTDGGILSSFPGSMYTTLGNDNIVNFLLALNPTLIITSSKYQEMECYNLRYLSNGIVTEKITKDTGLLLYSNSSDFGTRTINYSFDTVTDENVFKPNLSQYELIEN